MEIKVEKQCPHDDRSILRIYDVGLFKSSYEICYKCSKLPEFNAGVIEECEVLK